MTAQEDRRWDGHVHVDIAKRIATLTIDHGARNLLNPGILRQLRDALIRADGDDGVSGILLTGAGNVFCGGLDLSAIKGGADPTEFGAELVSVLDLMPKLNTFVAAAVNGDALAGGGALVAAADWAAGTPTTRVGTFEVSVGVWPMVAQVPLIHAIGARRAMENIGSGEPFAARRAYEVGLLQTLTVNPARAARKWLAAASRAESVMAHRHSVYQIAQMGYSDALAQAQHRFASQFEKSAR